MRAIRLPGRAEWLAMLLASQLTASIVMPTFATDVDRFEVGPTPTGETTDVDRRIADAVAFRQTFGLGADEAVVAALETSGRATGQFGIVTTASEEALMARRSEIPAELQGFRRYQMAHRGTWGGLWLTYPHGATVDNVLTINVAVTTDAAATELELAKVTPSDVRLEVFSVARTEDALDGKHEDIAASSGFFSSIGTAFHSVYTDVRSNSVVIAVSTIDPMIEQLITDRFGPGVQVIVGEPAEPDACSRTNCGPPWKGGVKVYRTANGNQCTSNFVARYYAGDWFYNLWTSGHCLSGTWKQGTSSGTTIGSTVNNYFVNGTRADVQTISMSSSYRDNRYINSTSVSCTNCTLGTIIYKQGHDTDLVGEVVCNNGAFSGKKCGDVISTNFTFVWTEENKTLYHQRLASYSRMSGDSGGPVVSATNTAAGSHTHHQVLAGFDRAIYSHVWEMEQATGQTVYLGGS